jgi:folate-binding protein YgfZ
MDLKRLELPAAVLIEASGPDAVRYLNGQVTQDVRLAAASGKAWPACVTDAKGRLQFRVLIHSADGKAVRVSCDHDGKEELLARLDRYLIADDAILEDISSAWKRVHVTGGALPEIPLGAYALQLTRIGVPGWDVWLPADSTSTILDQLEVWSAEEAETSRIEAGVPAWGSELHSDLLPPEAGLDRTDVSYSKGCYIGQEVISRIKSAGKVNRRLMRFSLEEGISCKAGDLLADRDGKDAGVITSVAPLAINGRRALLGYLRRSADESPVDLKEMPGTDVAVVSRC